MAMERMYPMRVGVLLQICAMVVMTFVPAAWGAEQGNGIQSRCTFSTYLEDADNRARYEAMISRGRYRHTISNSHENASIHFVIAKSGYGVEQAKNLDSFSAACLGCHDGKSASKVRPAIVNSPGRKKDTSAMSLAKHSIGMDYEKYSAASTTLKSLDEMGQHLNLTEGRVSCITCHDPLNPEKNHIRATKTGVDLCSACHPM